jgi:hypothetical protein
MENRNDRVMAYRLAKVISQEEIESVSGGAGAGMTQKSTIKPTGNSSNWDTYLDYVADF